MAILEGGRHTRLHDSHRSERRDASFLFLLAYPFCLAAAIAQRLVARRPAGPGSSRRQSVFGEANTSARSVIPFAFR